MKRCKNIEHKKPCSAKDKCEFCGKSTCSANYAYHVCAAPSGQKVRLNMKCAVKACKKKAQGEIAVNRKLYPLCFNHFYTIWTGKTIKAATSRK